VRVIGLESTAHYTKLYYKQQQNTMFFPYIAILVFTTCYFSITSTLKKRTLRSDDVSTVDQFKLTTWTWKTGENTISGDGIVNIPSSSSESKKINGIVVRVIVGDTTKVLLKDSDKIFVVESATSPYAQFTENGDEVEISYNDTKDIKVYVSNFFNKSLNK